MSIDDAERERRHRLVHAHMSVENRHDLDCIMATFSGDAEMLYNRTSFHDPESIRQAHAYFGLSPAAGAFEGLRVVPDAEHVTADEIVIEGRMCGKHVGEFQGFAPTGRDVEMPYVAFYRFDAAGRLTSERVVMNLAVLA
ncbi:MAG TPA: nuclear transport factor 2 family protein [Candidatus Eisenbacteria bacterium]|nr:nuclear transport factor 2 family protein [Candidatus Eisenbacteria bacterium]